MERVSFKTKAKNGIIKIPERYKELSNSALRITISVDKNTKIKLNKIKIINPYENVTNQKKLRTIREIGKWQKKVRDEWE